MKALKKLIIKELKKAQKAKELGKDYTLPLLIIPCPTLVENIAIFLEYRNANLKDSLLAIHQEIDKAKSIENEAKAFLSQDLLKIWGEE